jgi:serine/threonine protein kinase
MEKEEINSDENSVENEDECILFETGVQKDFLFFFKKSYDLVITDLRIYLLYKDGSIDRENDIKRSISYSRLKGITKSMAETPTCFVIHVKNTEDEHLYCDDIYEPIEMIKKVYTSLSKRNLSIFGHHSNNLKNYTSSDKDALLGISRMPLKINRLLDERVLTDEDSSDEDEDDKELFSDFFIIDRDEIQDIDDYLKQYNKEDKLKREQDLMDEGESVSIFIKKFKEGDDDQDDPASLEDFEILKVIDKGSFGKVFLVRNKRNEQLYAMKRIRKDILIEKGQIQNTKNERDILLSIEHPFLLGMDFVFQNDYRLYFFLDYIKGGNLFESLFTVKRFPEETVKFFAAQLVLAIGCLHDNKVVHRDLKPENILVEESGYIKLADFGLAKFLLEAKQSTYSFCGTAEYLAPEILEMKGHDYMVDWWTLGILLYELRIGRPPFLDKNHQKLGRMIKKGKVIFPDPIRHKIDMSEELKDIILKLLDRDPTQRLGNKGYKQIMNHPWFKKVDFDSILKKDMKAPFKPNLKTKVKNPNAFEYGKHHFKFPSSCLSSHVSSIPSDPTYNTI